MNTALQEKIEQWLEQAFSQIGEFCEVTLEVKPGTMEARQLPWPTAELDAGRRIGAVCQVRGGQPTQAFGLVFDRGLAIYLACRLLMLLPTAIEEKMGSRDGELDEDSLEGFKELGNVVSGIINQLAHEQAAEAHQIEFVGLHAPGHPPSNSDFPEQLYSFTVKVQAEARTFKATLCLTNDVISNWLGDLLEPAKPEAEAAPTSGGADVDEVGPEVHRAGRNPWLVLDARREDARVLVKLLAGEGVAAIVATNRAEAIEAMKAQLVEGLFIDIGLPENGGLVFLKMLRQNFLTNDLPIVMTSSAVTREEVMEAVRSGATHIAVKPINDESLAGCIAKAMNRHPRFRAAVHAAEEAAAVVGRAEGEAAA